MSTIEQRALAALRRLAPPGSRMIVATSGGPDSQCLLHLVARLAQALDLAALYAAGVNHGLRAGADTELELAASLAASLGVPFTRLVAQVDRRGNLLAAARDARYAVLQRHADDLDCGRIAVAHSATDQAETVLFRLARGAGVRGAAGMPARRGRIVRPLLAITRPEILSYLEAHGIPFARDPSNDDARRARARLRAHVLPALESLNAGAIQNLARFAARARRDDAMLERLAHDELRRRENALGALHVGGLGAGGLGALGPRIVAAWLRRHGIVPRSSDIERVFALKRDGASVRLATASVTSSRAHLWICAASPYELALDVPGRADIPGIGLAVESRLVETASSPPWRGSCSARQVAFDADTLHLGLRVRSARPGDKLRPFGLRGSTKVGDLFTNLKIPRPLRAQWPIVMGGDEVAWVTGLRRGALAPVTDGTRRVLVLELRGVMPWIAC